MLDSFCREIETKRLDLCGMVVLKGGKKVFETRWKEDFPHNLYSASKAFTAAAVGLCVKDGLLSADDPVLPFFEKDAVRADPRLGRLTVRHLLTMTAGFSSGFLFEDRKTIAEKDWVRYALNYPVSDLPGKKFRYNNACSYLLSVIVEKVSGWKMADYLRARLFEPLGIRSFEWEECPAGHTFGASGLFLRTGEMARFGQLCLDLGAWNGRQLIPRRWMMESTGVQVVTGNREPHLALYGYQFWGCPYNGFMASGSNSQFMIVHPQIGTVIAVNSDEKRMAAVLSCIWKHVLPELME